MKSLVSLGILFLLIIGFAWYATGSWINCFLPKVRSPSILTLSPYKFMGHEGFPVLICQSCIILA